MKTWANRDEFRRYVLFTQIPVTICIDDKTREDALKKNIRQYREGAVFDKWFKLLPQKGYNVRRDRGSVCLSEHKIIVLPSP